MQTIIIILGILLLLSSFITLYAILTAKRYDEETPVKFEPRKMTDLSSNIRTEVIKPKRKYKKRVKKPVVEEKKKPITKTTAVKKTPVGRPRKTTV